MSTSGDQGNAPVDHLFESASNAFPDEAGPAAAPGMATEQPLPPDMEYSYQSPPVQQPTALPQAQPEPVPQHQPPMVPLPELIDTRRRAQAAEESLRAERQRIDQLEDMMRKLTQPQQPQPEPIDPELDPVGAYNALRAEMYQQNLNTNLNMSERYARQTHGSELVDAALEAAQRSGYAQTFVNRPDAYGEMVTWYQGQRAREEIGPDPTAFRARIEAEVRAKLIAEMRTGAQPQTNLPPSLSQATRTTNQAPLVESDKDFFNSTMNRRPR